ncbi:type IV pilin protein [Planktothrix paucivesiculata]|uniref:Prepilin-type N-terminal cleavage/methylation domain-containing protein n=1 Tax=Planktothrix paucivesiculata PCC 9631 TaxID=671071 RepID=A0A7Z9E160_9CYAN|nr:type II secretion system protein [Planktothrix paucivesiculata]VXD20750.1 hypothetical protein PL9631_520133 [Planktothrix paucivesiculata PCC 9631]
MAKKNQPKFPIHNLNEGGFTLIELLVVILIMGALAAIGVPIYWLQVQKAKEVEPKIYTSSCLHVQQANYEATGTISGDENSQLEEQLVSEDNKYKVNASLYKSQNSEDFIQTIICCVANSQQENGSSYAQALVYTNQNQVVSIPCNQVASIKP